MATFLDITTLQNFSLIFVFLFVIILVYAMLNYLKVLGSNQIVIGAIAFLAAIFTIISPLATLIIEKLAPIIGVLLVLLAVVMIGGKMIGVSTQTQTMVGLRSTVLVIFVIAIIVGSLAVVRSNIDVPETGEDFEKTSTVIFNPNFLGMILIFLVAVFAVGLLAMRQT